MTTRFLTAAETQTLEGLLRRRPFRIAAEAFEMSLAVVISTPVDGCFAIEYRDRANSPQWRYVTIENSLEDVDGAWDVPKLVINAVDAATDLSLPVLKYLAKSRIPHTEPDVPFSSVDLAFGAAIHVIEVWQTVDTHTFSADGGTFTVSSDTGLRIVLDDGYVLTFAVDDSIVCTVKLALTESAASALLERMTLRQTLRVQ